ncbi:hypothetical protein GS575_04380 [Rhodococcus hoagii]|nr:hypothetical protein [Prescottella equi]
MAAPIPRDRARRRAHGDGRSHARREVRHSTARTRAPLGRLVRGGHGQSGTHERRVALLRERGLTDDELGRLHSPIGLDLGARTPEETAVFDPRGDDEGGTLGNGTRTA